MDKKKRIDPYKNLKTLGYNLSQLPDKYNLKELTRYAKFYLASKTGTLLKDPIWDTYTTEEMLTEFYAYLMEDREYRLRFEQESGIKGEVDDFASWAEKKIQEDSKVRDKVLGQMEENIKFSPNDVIGE
jgi:hypothetical protein